MHQPAVNVLSDLWDISVVCSYRQQYGDDLIVEDGMEANVLLSTVPTFQRRHSLIATSSDSKQSAHEAVNIVKSSRQME